jgi:hypothetical protein
VLPLGEGNAANYLGAAERDTVEKHATGPAR